MIHELKTWTEFYPHVLSYEKRFEIRKADRDYKVGDTLILKEWDNKKLQYTGRELSTKILYITDFYQPYGYVVMSISEPFDIK